MRILTHRPIQKLHLTPRPLEFFDEQELMDKLAGQPIRRRDEDSIVVCDFPLDHASDPAQAG
jgi:hypothetical protein